MLQILGLLGMYFDAVVVEVEKSLLFFRLALAILCGGSSVTPIPIRGQIMPTTLLLAPSRFSDLPTALSLVGQY